MKFLTSRLGILVLLAACNNPDPSKNQQPKQDTIVTDPSYIAETSTNHPATSFKSLNHTASFLNLQFGISKFEYDKLKDSLIHVKKLNRTGREIQYHLVLPDVSTTNLFDRDVDVKLQKTWTAIGVLNPTFYKDSLMQLDLEFRSNDGGQLYGFLEQNLIDKYSGQRTAPTDFFSKQKGFETLSVGKAMSWSIENQWQFGDTFVFLTMIENRKRISTKKYENSAIVRLIYYSQFLKQQQANEHSTKKIDDSKQLQKDF